MSSLFRATDPNRRKEKKNGLAELAHIHGDSRRCLRPAFPRRLLDGSAGKAPRGRAREVDPSGFFFLQLVF